MHGDAGVFLCHTHTYRLGVLDEDFCAPHLVLVWLHVDCPEQVLDPLTLIPTPLWPRLGGQDGISGGSVAGFGVAGWAGVLLRGSGQGGANGASHLCRNLANWRR